MKMAVGAAVFADSESVAAMVLHTGEAARSVSAETPGRERRQRICSSSLLSSFCCARVRRSRRLPKASDRSARPSLVA